MDLKNLADRRFFIRIGGMDDRKKKLADRLAVAITELSAILDELRVSDSVVRPEVRALVRELELRGYCLERSHKLKPGESPMRGMCLRHKRQVDAAIRAKKITPAYLFANGWWSEEEKKRGPKSKATGALADVLAPRESTEFSQLSDKDVIAKLTAITKPLLIKAKVDGQPAISELQQTALSNRKPGASDREDDELPAHADKGDEPGSEQNLPPRKKIGGKKHS